MTTKMSDILPKTLNIPEPIDNGLGCFRGLVFAAALYLAGGLLWLLVRWFGWANLVYILGWVAVGLAVAYARRRKAVEHDSK